MRRCARGCSDCSTPGTFSKQICCISVLFCTNQDHKLRRVDRAWLRQQLEDGRSVESIAKEVGRDPSTVSYWMKKFGFTSRYAPKFAARGGITRSRLEELVEEGLSIRQIAARENMSATTVRHWLARYGLKTTRPKYVLHGKNAPQRIVRECRKHGWTEFRISGSTDKRYRCGRCMVQAVVRRRRVLKQRLVAEAGGCCVVCGYDGYVGALQFHHLNPADKRYGISSRGLTLAFDRLREDARKCVLLCANCHAEVEGGARKLDLT